jgi:alkanesulfonate monooxygenase SsuD/methylene tetrahydromethanopterin reductase-like flavin-dependent oxidoreductase (luciferase family)
VARQADWWCIPGGSFAQVEHKMQVLREHCAAVGRDYNSIVKVGSVGALAVAPSRAEAQRLAEASIFYRPDAVGSVIAGEPAGVADQLRRFADLGASKLIMRFADFPRLDCASRFVEQVLPLLR